MLRVAAQLDCRTLSEFLHFGLGSLQQKTKAEVGDKTMMDALVPALRAFDQAGTDALSQALDAAAAAAQKGAEATVAILAKFGRAKTLGEKPSERRIREPLQWRCFSEGWPRLPLNCQMTHHLETHSGVVVAIGL
jgi:phosphoenolpyruvate---glycerone phosphotransferase subunit DhaL